MPDIPNRNELEAEMARNLSRLFGGFSGHILEVLEEYSYNFAAIPESVWQGLSQQQLGVLLPFLERVSIASAEQLMTATGIGVDWALVNQEAATWARSYSTFLAGQINASSRRAIADGIRNSIAAFFEEGLTHGQLLERLESDPKLAKLFTKDIRDRLGRIYGPQRAEMIAVTETTRAAVEGERYMVKELEKYGYRFTEIWQTNNDDLVCLICAPRNGKLSGDGWRAPGDGPPAHVRCRCWITHKTELI